MRILSSGDVARLLTMSDALQIVESACAENAAGNAEVPARVRLENPAAGSDSLFMPARLPRLNSMGIKIVSGVPSNAEKGLPVNVGVVVLFDDATGMPLLVMESGYLTDMRTGALTGVACKYLARSDSSVLGLIGTGAQARTQVVATAEVLSLREVRVFSRKPQRVKEFTEKMAAMLPGIRFIAAKSAEEAVKGADVVVCATSATSPVLSRAWISPGTFVSAVGAHTPQDREVDDETVRDAAVIVADCRNAVLASGGDIVIPLRKGLITEAQVVDLGDLVLGTKKGRQSPEEITFFKSVGFAAVDVCAAKALLGKAIETGVGIEASLYAD